jgi:hypothetical protein
VNAKQQAVQVGILGERSGRINLQSYHLFQSSKHFFHFVGAQMNRAGLVLLVACI